MSRPLIEIPPRRPLPERQPKPGNTFFPAGSFNVPPIQSLAYAKMQDRRVRFTLKNSKEAFAAAQQYNEACKAEEFFCFAPEKSKRRMTISVMTATDDEREEMLVSGWHMKVSMRALMWAKLGRSLTAGYFGRPTCGTLSCINPFHQIQLPFK